MMQFLSLFNDTSSSAQIIKLLFYTLHNNTVTCWAPN